MTSGTITTDRSAEDIRRRSQRGKGKLLAVLTVTAVVLLLRNAPHFGLYQEWYFSRLPLESLQREAKRDSGNPCLLYYLGLRLNQQSRYAEADGCLRTAVGLDPDTPRLRDAWAESLIHTGRITAAFGELSQFAGTHSDSAQAHLMLGKFYLSQEAMVRAAEELNRAVVLDPSLAEGWTALSAAQSANGGITQAIEAAEHAVSLRPQDSSVHLGLAELLLENKQVDRARQVFAETVILAPSSANAHREYARSLLEGENSSPLLQQAEEEARRALQLHPDDLAASLLMGKALLAQNKPADALPFLQRTAEASPYDHPSAFALMQAYTQLNQAKQASRWQRILQQRLQRVTAKQQLVNAIQKTPHAFLPHQQMARMLAEEGDIDGCLRHDAEALRCAPDAPTALVAAANHLAKAGHPDKALPVVQRAVEEAPNNPMARETQGDILLTLGRPQEAAKAYAKAVRGFPKRLKIYQKKLDDEYARNHPGYKPKPVQTP